MIGFKFKYEPFWLTAYTNNLYQLTDAKMGDQFIEDVKGGHYAVSGTITCDDTTRLTKFAENLPHMVCIVDGNVMTYKYMIPGNGVIEFMTSVQETNCINIHMWDNAWASEPHRYTLFIQHVNEIHDISRQDNYNWFVDIEHKPMEDIRRRLDDCGYVPYIFTLNEYVNPTSRRSKFLVNNKVGKPMQRIYESTGMGFGLNLMVYPISGVKKLFDGVPEEWV